MLPKINQILYIKINPIDGGESVEEYKTRIADITDDTIFIEIPVEVNTGRSRALSYGNVLSIYFFDDMEIKNYFISTVIGVSNNAMHLFHIAKPAPESITKVQRRHFLRVQAELEVAVKHSEQLQFVALSDDVGGGGISLLCDDYIPLTTHNVLDCWLLLPAKNGYNDHVPFKSEVVRIVSAGPGTQRVMMRFIDISDRDRQKIIQFCFDRQFEFRKN